jgi:hypothetical protein
MTSRPRLTRSIPFWALIAASLGSLGAGAYLLVDRLGTMDARLTDGTATNSDVYVGQTLAVLGAILVGAGVVGLALALTVGALRTLIPAAGVAAPTFADEALADGDDLGDADAEEPATVTVAGTHDRSPDTESDEAERVGVSR